MWLFGNTASEAAHPPYSPPRHQGHQEITKSFKIQEETEGTLAPALYSPSSLRKAWWAAVDSDSDPDSDSDLGHGDGDGHGDGR
jgi:hypothetical protein